MPCQPPFESQFFAEGLFGWFKPRPSVCCRLPTCLISLHRPRYFHGVENETTLLTYLHFQHGSLACITPSLELCSLRQLEGTQDHVVLRCAPPMKPWA